MKKSLIPDIVAFVDLILGIFSIVFIIDGSMASASLCILTATLCHWYGSRITKKLGAESQSGEALDLMSALVTFGVAPAVAACKLSLGSLGVFRFILLMLFTSCSALRLSRQITAGSFSTFYTGIPVTFAGSFLAIDNLVVIKYEAHTIFSTLFILLLSYHMVSSIRIKKL